MNEAIRFAHCPACNAAGWIADGLGDWIRCPECNAPPEPQKRNADVLTFARGARVRKPEVDNDLPPAA